MEEKVTKLEAELKAAAANPCVQGDNFDAGIKALEGVPMDTTQQLDTHAAKKMKGQVLEEKNRSKSSEALDPDIKEVVLARFYQKLDILGHQEQELMPVDVKTTSGSETPEIARQSA